VRACVRACVHAYACMHVSGITQKLLVGFFEYFLLIMSLVVTVGQSVIWKDSYLK